MQENTKSVVVKMTARRCFRTEPIYQYDVGHVLTFEGFELPTAFEVHFARSPLGKAVTQIGTDGVCTVPDMYAQSAGVIYAWLYIADADSGLTKYSIEIPVAKRAQITDQQPTPVEQSAIDQAIAALNAGVERSETAADAAESAQEAAEGYAESAGNSAITATNAANSATSAKTAAETAARNAATSATDAHTSREAADQSATNAGVSERNAAASASAAAGSATSAATSDRQASASATAASGSASTASTKASEAAQSATAAAGSAASASEDAGTASTAATAAGQSATAAAGSATAAAGSATSAGQSATAAAGSAQTAQAVLDSIPADYSELSDDVNSLKSVLDATNEEVFCSTTSARDATSTATSWRLNDNGLCSSDSGYKLVKYAVTVGDILKVISDDRFQFQTVASVPSSGNSNRVGNTYGVGTFYVTVPATATYLIVSTPTTSNASVYSAESVKNKIGNFDAEILKTDIELVSIRNEVNGKGANLPIEDITNGKYRDNTGTEKTSSLYCYGYVDVSGKELITVDTTNCSDTIIINICGNAKAFNRNFVNWGSPNKYTISIGDGDKYLCISCQKTDLENVSVYVDNTESSIDYRLTEAETDIDTVTDLSNKVAISSSNEEKINYFNQAHIINAYISDSGVIKSSSGDKTVWVKLLPNTLFTLNVFKKANVYNAIAFYNTEPVVNAAGINNKIVAQDADSFSETFETNNGYVYLAIKYWTNSATTYTEQEVLDSIRIENTNGGVNTSVRVKTKNARHVPSNAGKPLTIVHFSDLHYDVGALKRISEGIKKLGDLVDDSICTGDIVGSTYEQITSWWNPHILTCIGNHDSASYSSETGYNWTALSMANRDEYYIAPFESNWGITHTSGTSYYYKDYNDQNVRMIVMDGMLYTDNGAEATAQTSWLDGLLADAITNNLHVLIAIHSPHGGATAKECSFSRYGQGTMPTYSDCNTPQAVIDAVAAKITGGLHFIGYIVGHTHQDNVWDAENNGKQLMYCVTCSSVKQTQWVNSDQYRGTDADAYNIITIDTENTLVKIIRCGGADIDDHMRTRKAICFNYSTGQKVGEIL